MLAFVTSGCQTSTRAKSRALGLGMQGGTSTECTTVGGRGREVTFNPLAPGSAAPIRVGGSEDFLGVACPSALQCTAVNVTGEEVTFNPTAPGTPTTVIVDPKTRPGNSSPSVPRVSLQAIACPEPTECTAVDQTGAEVSFNPAAPGQPISVALASGGEGNGVACPSPTQCIVVAGGSVFTFEPRTPGTPTSFRWEPRGLGAISVACPSTSQCTAVTNGEPTEGEALTFNPNPTATSPTSTSNTRSGAWTRARCKSTYRLWIKRHRRATRSRRTREARALNKQHGCPRAILK
jgi:hypothetical protein